MKSLKSLPIAAALALALTVLSVAPSSVGAFGLSGIGARVGQVDPEGAGGAFAVGGHLEFEEGGTRLHLQPGVMFWSSDGVHDVNPNFDLMYHFAPAGRVSPYLGAGAGLHFYSVDLPVGSDTNTDLGANLFGGVLVPMSSVNLFGEARYVASDRSQFAVTGGVTLPFGHH
jgi:hypothetical protein